MIGQDHGRADGTKSGLGHEMMIAAIRKGNTTTMTAGIQTGSGMTGIDEGIEIEGKLNHI